MIKIRRLSDEIDYYDTYRVVLDEKIIMELKNGELKDYDAADGKHTLRIVSDNYKSETLTFDTYKGEITEFECKPNHGKSIVEKYARKLLLGKIGISLIKKNDFYL